jgi:hypothetical protein
VVECEDLHEEDFMRRFAFFANLLPNCIFGKLANRVFHSQMLQNLSRHKSVIFFELQTPSTTSGVAIS